MSFINLSRTPDKNSLIATYRLEPASPISIKDLTDQIAAESSIGTWVDIPLLAEPIAKGLAPLIFSIEENIVSIAYPQGLFEEGSVPQLLSALAGNIFGMKDIANLRLLNIEIPDGFATTFDGPRFGIDGIRKKLRIKDRPIVGTIIKPKVGLSPEQYANALYESLIGGCDIVKDDENLTSLKICPFEERVRLSLQSLKRAEQETGESKAYVVNITAPMEEMMRRGEYVQNLGGSIMMVDVITAGFSALQQLRKSGPELIIHGHRAMHGAFTRSKLHGIHMNIIALICRLAGVDQLHIGSVVGKMEGGLEDTKSILNITRDKRMGKIKPMMPIASGGLHPGHIPDLMEIFGNDVIIQMGGGIHGHPDGTIEGARAAKAALEASLRGYPLSEAAKENKSLSRAMEHFEKKSDHGKNKKK